MQMFTSSFARSARYLFNFEWMNNNNNIKQLQKDNIDLEILQSELLSRKQLSTQAPWKNRLLRILQSKVVRIILCTLVLIDAVIVIAEIILEIKFITGVKNVAIENINETYWFFQHFWPKNYVCFSNHSEWHSNDISMLNYSNPPDEAYFEDKLIYSMQIFVIHMRHLLNGYYSQCFYTLHNESQSNMLIRTSSISNSSMENNLMSTFIALLSANTLISANAAATSPSSYSALNNFGRKENSVITSKASLHPSSTMPLPLSYATKIIKHDATYKPQLLHKVSHYLHVFSICILGIFVLEATLKIVCFGKHFFEKKFEVVDAVIIITSFFADIIFVYINSGEISLMVVFLLWRIIRVINGLMMHEKQRDEFRIQLQKRARRISELKVENLQTVNEFQDKHIFSLTELCKELGATEEQLEKTKPRYVCTTKRQSNNALKSMAAMSAEIFSGFAGSQHRKSISLINSSFFDANSSTSKRLYDISENSLLESYSTSTGIDCLVNEEITYASALLDDADVVEKAHLFDTDVSNGKPISMKSTKEEEYKCIAKTNQSQPQHRREKLIDVDYEINNPWELRSIKSSPSCDSSTIHAQYIAAT